MSDENILFKLNQIAEIYVRLVLSVGLHDESYVDAYFGPPQVRDEVKAEKKSLSKIKLSALSLIEILNKLNVAGEEEIVQLRAKYLRGQLSSMVARVVMLQGKKLSFDEEAKSLYDANPPVFSESHFKNILAELDKLLPGSGSINDRYLRFKEKFIIPKNRLDSVFKAAIDECRKKTKKYISLPDHESFMVEYITGKSWSGYNWYKGDCFSLIQVNTDLPIYIDRAVDLAAHEGYPGHHVYNLLLDLNLFRKRKWTEFSVYALFSPQSLIAEGTANFGIEVAFPGNERVRFEKEVLFPIIGLDPTEADLYYKIHDFFHRLGYAGNEAARGYLDGKMNNGQAVKWLNTYALMSDERARQRISFFDTYRSYVINYNLGQDLVKRYIEERGGTADNPTKRWEQFALLISSPRLPSGL
jgi:hypothetical protein